MVSERQGERGVGWPGGAARVPTEDGFRCARFFFGRRPGEMKARLVLDSAHGGTKADRSSGVSQSGRCPPSDPPLCHFAQAGPRLSPSSSGRRGTRRNVSQRQRRGHYECHEMCITDGLVSVLEEHSQPRRNIERVDERKLASIESPPTRFRRNEWSSLAQRAPRKAAITQSPSPGGASSSAPRTPAALLARPPTPRLRN